MTWTPAPLVLAALVGITTSVAAQEPAAWNSPRALELIEGARQRRAVPRADSGLVNYQAAANGHIYFYLDRTDSDERTLVKVDQIALEIFWAAPNLTKQRIIGLRDVSRLPNRMQYHLDHLTVVQDEFGDVIRMGDGDEVRDVPHPAAPGSGSVYDFRLVDSLSVHLAGTSEPVRVYELEVRPRRLDQPALIGSIFIDKASSAIVRMNFTFTPASYVDRRLDYIRVSLDNGLWDGRHWLPNEQELEIRRQAPELNLPAGAVIRGVLRIGGYQFNQELPPGFFRGPPVVAMPKSVRERHAFEAGLYDGLDELGLSTSTDLSTLTRQAAEIVGRHYLSGLPRLRLFLPGASSVLRYNRAESLFLGTGLSYSTGGASRFDLRGGYATGPDRVMLGWGWRRELGYSARLQLEAEYDALRDMGIRPGTAGLLNTMAAAFAGEDFLDPYYARGIGLRYERRFGGPWSGTIELGYEEHRAAELSATTAVFDGQARFRPVRSITEGTLLSGRASLRRQVPPASAGGLGGGLVVELGAFEDDFYLLPTLQLAWSRRTGDRRASLDLRAATGAGVGDLPPQKLFLLGGAATLPGYEYRSFAGTRFALAELEASREIVGPWVRGRVLGAVGWAGLGSATLPTDWQAGPTNGLRATLGAGIGLVYDLLRIDLARGLSDGGKWQAILSVNPSLADIL